MRKRGGWELAWIGQAALIVLPVAILSGVALHFLREDKAAIEQEARDLAKSLAPDAARRMGEALGWRLAGQLKQGRLPQGEIADSRGTALPDYPRVPVPADWRDRLPPRQAQLWRTAEAALYRPDAAGVRQALESLAGSSDAGVQANAKLGLLRLAARDADRTTLSHQAVLLARRYPAALSESGVPVAGLALLLALSHVAGGAPDSELLAEVEQNVIARPSFLSPELLLAAETVSAKEPARGQVSALRGRWLTEEGRRENTRDAMRSLAPQLEGRRLPAALASGTGLALCEPQKRGWRVTLVPDDALKSAMPPGLPAYLGASVEIGGGHWRIQGEPSEATPAPLASAAGDFSLGASYGFRLVLDLANRDLLFAPYRRRLKLTEWLILCAAAAALAGLLSLRRTLKEQLKLGEMKSNLVSSVSHELRAPIAAVRLMAESLESGRIDGDAKRRDYYRLIVRECRRLSSLVENVLDFARIDQGRKEYHFEPLDPMALLRHTMMLMEPGAAERQVRLSMAEPAPAFDDLQPSWDGEAVEQSLVNLLDNAIKHSPAGSEVRLEPETAPGVVRFWIADQGPGIPKAEQQRIFDLFYRRGSELRRETAGVGIGLSIVKHVAEAHGGRVLVESTVGEGSRFGLELPR